MESSTKISLNCTGILSFEPSIQALSNFGQLELIEPLSHGHLIDPIGRNKKQEFAVFWSWLVTAADH